MKKTIKQLDFKSVLIGVLSSVLVFVLVGAKETPANLGDIVVNSIKIVDGGKLSIANKDGLTTVMLANSVDGGFLSIRNNEGNPTGGLGQSKDDFSKENAKPE